MTRAVSGVVPNLVNGISQQAPALRLPSQAELQENYYPTIVEGLKDRPPTEFVAKLMGSLGSNTFTHIINRDVTERYVVVWDSTASAFKVWDFDGNEKTVNAPNGYGYMAGITDAVADILGMTVADYTFIVNKKKLVANGTTTSPARNPEALVNILEGNYAKTYSITINGATAGTYTTSASDPATLDTDTIASNLVSSLGTNGYNAAPWHSDRYGNAIHIYRDDGTDFTIAVQDGFNGHAAKVVKGSTQHFSDLSYFGPEGFVAEIIGDQSTDFDNYWVRLTAEDGTNVWKECVKPGVKIDLDKSTMPHALIREADGTFTFQEMTWDVRKCGDGDKVSPDPSFVGQKINDIFFHHDRLGFLANQNAILSRTGSFFDFYRTSATTLLDDDPIDVGASHTKVSILKHAIPYQRQLLIFSDQTQFAMSGSDTSLTPKNVSLDPLTEYVSDVTVKPLALGLSVFFAAARGNYAAIWEYVIDATTTGQPIGTANEDTDHAPSYIPTGIFKIAGTSNESVLAVLTDGDPNAIYVYKFYYENQQKKLQSAWCRFPIPGGTIRNAEFINSDLYIVIERADGVYLEKMRFQPAAQDDGLDFLVHLDQRVHTDQLAAPTYDAVADQTTYTLPYSTSSDIAAVTSSGNVNVLPALQLTVASATGNSVVLNGDTTSYPIWFGYTYERRYRFSTFYDRQANGSGGSITVQRGRTQVIDMTIAFNKSAYFKIEVTPQGRATRSYVYTGRTLGDPDNLLGVVKVRDGKKTIPILSRNDRVTIDIVNDSWMPSAFVNVLWTGKLAESATAF